MISAPSFLLTDRERRSARELIESAGLAFEESWDDLVGIYEDERLVATAARSGYVLKMFAIHPDHQGGEVLGGLASALMERGRQAGEETFFVFTRPENAVSFQRLNFRLLVASGAVALLEYGPGIDSYLRSQAGARREGRNGAVVINGNPFTLGHLHLVETAAARVDHLYMFIVREDRSAFPYEVRRRLAERATRHLANVLVLDTSRYAVSAGTFPSYFLRRLDDRAREQMEIDLNLFGRHLAPALSIRTRFVGQEPYCPTTAAYNQAMVRVLSACGVEVVEIPRCRALAAGGETEFISATQVRAAFLDHDFARLAGLVPTPTLEFLRSPDGETVRQRLLAA